MRDLCNSIIEAVQSSEPEELLQPLNVGSERQNELLFFFKPECFLESSDVQRADLVGLALKLFSDFDVVTAGAVLFRGEVLANRQIMDRHYGFINRVSRDARALSDTEMDTIRAEVGASPSTPVLGGHEFLEAHPEYTPQSLDAFWATKRSRKLRSGLYFEKFEIAGDSVVLVNGFHPAQLAHFTTPGHVVVLTILQSDLPWKVLRTYMLGDTFPEKAAPGSFRRTLYDDPKRFGLSSVSIAANAGHMSAGPFEGMFELSNFLSSSDVVNFNVSSTTAWKTAERTGVSLDKLRQLASNPVAHIAGGDRTLFDATEELDTASACHLFRSRW